MTNHDELTRVNLGAIDAVIDQIERQPITWQQDTWRCDTGMCVAGWLCELNGDRWLSNTNPVAMAMVIVPLDVAMNGPDSAFNAGYEDDVAALPGGELPEGTGITHACYRAMNLLSGKTVRELTNGSETSDELFYAIDGLFSGTNTLADIKRIRDELAVRQGDPTRYSEG